MTEVIVSGDCKNKTQPCSGSGISQHPLLEEYKPPDWASHLPNVPSHRLKLINRNTPIEEWNPPGIPKDFHISIKRDDMTDCIMTGTKARMLEMELALGARNDVQRVIATNGINSNLCRIAVVACTRIGLPCDLVLYHDSKNPPTALTNNMLMMQKLSSNIHYIDTPCNIEVPIVDLTKFAAQHARRQDGKSLVLQPGGVSYCGLFGYMDVIEEIRQQTGLDTYSDIVLPCSSGGTSAGVAIANYLAGSKCRVHIVVVNKRYNYFKTKINTLLKAANINLTINDVANVILPADYEDMDNPMEVYRALSENAMYETGVQLEPSYTAKAFHWMKNAMINTPQCFKGNNVLFLHTGGFHGCPILSEGEPVLGNSAKCQYWKYKVGQFTCLN